VCMYVCVCVSVFGREHSDDRLYEYNILLFAASNNDTFL